MKLRGVLFKVNDLFNPPEVRRAKSLQQQWDELDDVAAIVEDRNNAHKFQEGQKEEADKLRTEMNILLDRVASDMKRIKTIANRLTASHDKPH